MQRMKVKREGVPMARSFEVAFDEAFNGEDSSFVVAVTDAFEKAAAYARALLAV